MRCSPKTRVKMAQIDGDPTTAYINANFVVGPDKNPKRYIAVRGMFCVVKARFVAPLPLASPLTGARHSSRSSSVFPTAQAMAPMPATLRTW
jgi:hypothetical protein